MNSPKGLRALAIILGVVLVLALAPFVVLAVEAEGEEETMVQETRLHYVGGSCGVHIYSFEWRGKEYLANYHGGIVEVTR